MILCLSMYTGMFVTREHVRHNKMQVETAAPTLSSWCRCLWNSARSKQMLAALLLALAVMVAAAGGGPAGPAAAARALCVPPSEVRKEPCKCLAADPVPEFASNTAAAAAAPGCRTWSTTMHCSLRACVWAVMYPSASPDCCLSLASRSHLYQDAPEDDKAQL
jgi:hypothetical protein